MPSPANRVGERSTQDTNRISRDDPDAAEATAPTIAIEHGALDSSQRHTLLESIRRGGRRIVHVSIAMNLRIGWSDDPLMELADHLDICLAEQLLGYPRVLV